MKLQAKLNLTLFLIFIFGVAAINLLRPQSQSVSELEQRTIQQSPVFTTERLFDGDLHGNMITISLIISRIGRR